MTTETTIMEDLAALVCSERKARRWSQQTLADFANVSQGSLSHFEKRGTGLHIEKVVAVLRILSYQLAVVPIDCEGNTGTVYPETETTNAEQAQP